MPLWHAAPPRGAAANGFATGCWPGATTGLGAAGLAGAGLTGAGAGWANTDDEITSEAAMVTITIRMGEGIGINVTGSDQKGNRDLYSL